MIAAVRFVALEEALTFRDAFCEDGRLDGQFGTLVWGVPTGLGERPSNPPDTPEHSSRNPRPRSRRCWRELG